MKGVMRTIVINFAEHAFPSHRVGSLTLQKAYYDGPHRSNYFAKNVLIRVYLY